MMMAVVVSINLAKQPGYECKSGQGSMCLLNSSEYDKVNF